LILCFFGPDLGTGQPLIQWIPGIKQPEREVDYSPPSSSEVKNAWNYTSIPSMPSWHGASLRRWYIHGVVFG